MHHGQLRQQSEIGSNNVSTFVDDSSASTAEQACTTDDGDFERMMARFDDLAKQEAADAALGAAGQFIHLLLEDILHFCLRHK